MKNVNTSSKSKNKLMYHNSCLYCLQKTFQKRFRGNFHVKHDLRAVTQHTYPEVKFFFDYMKTKVAKLRPS